MEVIAAYNSDTILAPFAPCTIPAVFTVLTVDTTYTTYAVRAICAPFTPFVAGILCSAHVNSAQ